MAYRIKQEEPSYIMTVSNGVYSENGLDIAYTRTVIGEKVYIHLDTRTKCDINYDEIVNKINKHNEHIRN